MSRKPKISGDDVRWLAGLIRTGIRMQVISERYHLSRQVIYNALKREGYNLKELKKGDVLCQVKQEQAPGCQAKR